jgi:hypothetical protein
MAGTFGWNTTRAARPTSPVSPTHSETSRFQSVDIPGLDAPPATLGLLPVSRREDGAQEEGAIFRYSSLKVKEDPALYRETDVEEQAGVVLSICTLGP